MYLLMKNKSYIIKIILKHCIKYNMKQVSGKLLIHFSFERFRKNLIIN